MSGPTMPVTVRFCCCWKLRTMLRTSSDITPSIGSCADITRLRQSWIQRICSDAWTVSGAPVAGAMPGAPVVGADMSGAVGAAISGALVDAGGGAGPVSRPVPVQPMLPRVSAEGGPSAISVQPAIAVAAERAVGAAAVDATAAIEVAPAIEPPAIHATAKLVAERPPAEHAVGKRATAERAIGERPATERTSWRAHNAGPEDAAHLAFAFAFELTFTFELAFEFVGKLPEQLGRERLGLEEFVLGHGGLVSLCVALHVELIVPLRARHGRRRPRRRRRCRSGHGVR